MSAPILSNYKLGRIEEALKKNHNIDFKVRWTLLIAYLLALYTGCLAVAMCSAILRLYTEYVAQRYSIALILEGTIGSKYSLSSMRLLNSQV